MPLIDDELTYRRKQAAAGGAEGAAAEAAAGAVAGSAAGVDENMLHGGLKCVNMILSSALLLSC